MDSFWIAFCLTFPFNVIKMNILYYYHTALPYIRFRTHKHTHMHLCSVPISEISENPISTFGIPKSWNNKPGILSLVASVPLFYINCSHSKIQCNNITCNNNDNGSHTVHDKQCSVELRQEKPRSCVGIRTFPFL